MDAPRDKQFLLAKAEGRTLEWIARRLPRWVLPDHMTALGVVAALGIAGAYLLSNGDKTWLWAASALLVVHWLGDSLDGTLARVRKIERPRYGYYLDHLVDALATAVIGLGLGLSPYMLLSVGLVIVIAYLVLSINTYLETYAFGVFTLGYGRLGPTEVRLALIVLNTLIAVGVGLGFQVGGLGLTVLDLIGLAIAGVMIAALLARAARNLRVLAEQEPAGLGVRPLDNQARACATTRRSSAKALRSAWRASSSRWRRMEEGWIVAHTIGARSESSSSPRCWVTRKDAPNTAFAAVAPRNTSASGATTRSSSSSQGLHASISKRFGVWWMRRRPRSSNLKCLTTLVR